MYNRIILVGNLTRDVELRYLPSGSALAKIGLATNRRYKKQDGTNGEEVCFIDVNLFGRTAEVANQYLRKGSKILIEGRLVLESWVDQTGQKKTRHSVTAESMQMLDSRGSATTPSYENEMDGGYSQQGYGNPPQQGYGNPPQQGYGNLHNSYGGNPQQQFSPSQNPSQKIKEDSIPEIDIDDDIPF